MKRKSKASKKTQREVACRHRTPEAEKHYKEWQREYMRQYRAGKRRTKEGRAALKAKKAEG